MWFNWRITVIFKKINVKVWLILLIVKKLQAYRKKLVIRIYVGSFEEILSDMNSVQEKLCH